MSFRSFQVFLSGSALCLAAAGASAQGPAKPSPPLLRPEEAVRLALENNYSLSLARDEARIAKNNRSAGIGPFLPDVNASAVHRGVIGESESDQALGASARLMIFDGFASYHAYQRLKALERSASLEQRQALETTLEDVLAGYYAVTQEKLQLGAIEEQLAVSGERARLAQARMEVGAGSRLEQLQALSDLNADSAAYLSQQTAVRDAKVRLSLLLARDPAGDFDVLDTIPLEAALPAEAWRAALPERNAAILQAREARRAARSGVKEAQGSYWPEVIGSMQYSATPEAIANDDFGFREQGLSYSIALSVPIFDQLRRRREVGNAKIGLRQDETRLRQRETEIAGEYEQALQRHASAVRRVTLEERNLEVSRLQAEAAQERYKLGASSSLEFRDAQTRLLESRSRLASARQEAKAAELSLKRLAGMLVQEVPSGSADAKGGPESGPQDPARPGERDGKD